MSYDQLAASVDTMAQTQRDLLAQLEVTQTDANAAKNAAESLLAQQGLASDFTYETHAAFLASNVPPQVQSVSIKGYYKAGDGGGHTKVRISQPSPVKPWHKQSADGAWWQITADFVSLVTFGGKRTYAFDSRQAFLDAMDYARTFQKPIMDVGVYGIKGAVTTYTTQVAIIGIGPVAKIHIGTYDDKKWLRRGTDTDGVLFKDKLPGLAFIFKNGGTRVKQTLAERTDEYNEVYPCFSHTTNHNQFKNFAIIQDNDCFDEAGVAVPLGLENTATDYDMGLLDNDGSRGVYDDLTIWGYYNKSGMTIWSKPNNDDPDNNLIRGGMFSGRHGLSLLGASGPSPNSYGLSGTTCIGAIFGSKDHSARVSNVGGKTVADYYAMADAEKWRALYIDGDVAANTVDLSGHNFHGCVFRTQANYVVELGYCTNLKIFGGIHESGNYGVPGSNTTKWLATQPTAVGVVIDELRISEIDAVFHADFAGVIPFKVRGGISGNGADLFSKPRATVPGGWSVMKVGTGRGIGDVGIQFTNDLTSEGNMFNMGLDESEGSFKIWLNNVQCWAIEPTGVVTMKNYKATPGAVKAIVSDAIAIDSGFHAVNGQGGVDDNLSTITGGVSDGQILVLRRGTGIITVKHAVGNIRCGSDRVLNSSLDRITLEWDAGQLLWVMRSFADNA